MNRGKTSTMRWDVMFPILLVIAFVRATTVADASPVDRPVLPEPLGYVSDHAGILDPDWKERIRSVCQDLERKTGVEMVVVTVPGLRSFRSANEYASAMYQRWGVGSAQKEHGLLILASIEDRQAAVTVGKGLVGTITQPIIEDVGRQYLDSAFRNGRFGEGLYRTTVALASHLQEIRVGETAHRHLKGLGTVLTVFTFVGALAFLWWISRPDLRHPFRRLHRGEYWGTGQGGFGGNFGGFGGGEGLR